MFDIEAYLDSKNISYKTQGKNVSHGWIGINCIFCNDASTHLGINRESGVFTCFKCGTKGFFTRIIQIFDNCSYHKAKSILEKLKTYSNIEEPVNIFTDKVKIPYGIDDKPSKLHTKYLEERNFDIKKIIKKYKIMFGHVVGEFKHRIIIPFFFNHEIVTFTSRSIFKEAELKYKHLAKHKSVLDAKKTLYNIDTIRDKAIIVEGPLDVWRIGDGAIALSGTNFTTDQLRLLLGVKTIFILFDQDAINKAYKFSDQLIANHIEVLHLDKGDPSDMNESEIFHLRKELKL